MRAAFQLIVFAVALAWTPLRALAQSEVVIATISDGPPASGREYVSLGTIQLEIEQLVGDEFSIEFPADKQLDGGWTLAGVRAAIDQLLADPEVDIILTTGLVAGSEMSRIEDLEKPTVVTVVADAELQGLPYVGDENSATSGKRNYVYLSDFRTIDDDILSFHEVVGFSHLAVFVDALTLQSIPDLSQQKADELSGQLGATITLIAVTDSVDAALNALPAGADAVYVTPVLRLSNTQMDALSARLIERQLPSLSFIGYREVALYGLLLATGGQEADQLRLTRRVGLNVQRILRGEDAGEIEIVFQQSRRRIINMRTAEAINFVPAYSVLTDAVQIPEVPIESGPSMSLSWAMLESLNANLSLRTASFDPLISLENVAAARANLRPQLGLALSRTTIDSDRANPLFQPERLSNAELSGSQIIYSDDARANLRVAERFAEAAGFNYATAELNTMQAAARAYLTVLRARALENVQRQNLEVTRENLELARIRERIGFSGRGDRLRWESQLATDLQNVITAEADKRGALVALNQILNRPQNQDFTAPQTDVMSSIAIFADPRFQAFIDNATAWEMFQNFSVAKALADAPELMELERIISGQERVVLSSRRKRWLPEFALGGARGSVLSRGGAGSDISGLGFDNSSWSFLLSAEVPVFTSGALQAGINTEQYELRQLHRARDELAQGIEARTRLALQRASGTYPSIAPAMAAAAAATENLQLITDAYSQGAATVTALIDAQRAANIANLRVADVQYAALTDIIDVFRSTADFSIFIDPGSTEAWFQSVEAYFQENQSASQ